jgi:hypothetical protein
VASLGTVPEAIRLSSLTLFLIFIAINYFLLKRLFNKPVSVFVNLLMIFMPAALFDVSTRVWGGHAELWSFAAGLLLLSFFYFETEASESRKTLFLFLMGLVTGAALWVSEFFLLFLVPYVLYFALRFRPNPDENLFLSILNGILLRRTFLPRWLKTLLIILHSFIALFLLMQCLGIFWDQLPLATDPPFQIKEMKKIAYLLFGEMILLSVLKLRGLPDRMEGLKKIGVVGAGTLLGHLPALIFNFLGGEGLRIFHKSGFVSSSMLLRQVADVFGDKLPQFILGLAYTPGLRAWAFLFLIGGIVLWTAFVYRRDLLIFWKMPRGFKPSYTAVFFLTGAFTLFANTFSTLEADRYMVPLYLSLAGIVGIFLGQILWTRSRVLALVLFCLIAGHFAYTDYLFLKKLPKDRSETHRQIIDYLEENQIRGGLAPRSLSHLLTFLAGERIVFSTYPERDRYLPHERFTQKLWRRAYVFEANDSAGELFRNNSGLFSKVTETKVINRVTIYLVEFPKLKERGFNLSYSEWRPKPHFRFYLNE